MEGINKSQNRWHPGISLLEQQDDTNLCIYLKVVYKESFY